jgi:hypothetical protein
VTQTAPSNGHAAVDRTRRRQRRRQRPRLVGWLVPLAAAMVIGLGLSAAVVGPAVAVGIAIAIVLLGLCAYQPSMAVYIYLASVPIISGIERGLLIPMVRPNEAFFALLLAGAIIGGLVRFGRGDPVPWRPHPLDIPLGVFVVMSVLWPIPSLLLREQSVDLGEYLAVFPVVKLTLFLVLVRLTITTQAQVVRCVRVVAWPASVLALIAILQTLQFGPVLSLLETFWSPEHTDEGVVERGSSTLASSIATGDYIIIALTIVICCSLNGLLDRRERLVLGLVLGAGVLAAGQFSTWISAGVVAILLLWRHRELRRLWVRLLPLGIIALAVGAPALISRLQGFGDGYGVPRSWLGRWDNVFNIHLPHFDSVRVFMGISPDSVLQAPETWRDVVYLESGYLQLLWVGGVPLLLAFVWLSIAVIRNAARQSSERTAAGACASALVIVWWFLILLTVIDPHLTLRGAGELIFLLLAITSGRIRDNTS